MSSDKLRVLWRSGLGAEVAKERQADLEFDLKIETDRDKAKDYKDWLEVLVDGKPDETIAGRAQLKTRDCALCRRERRLA